MKHLSLITIIALAAAGCGTKKNPVGGDLKTIREKGKVAQEIGPQKPTVVTNTVVIEKPQVVTKETSTIDDKFLVITTDAQMSFNEGHSTSYQVRARSLAPGVQIKLVATDLPEGATLTASQKEKDLYILSWTPALYTIPSNSQMKTFKVNLKAQVASTSSAEQTEKLKNLVREKEVSLFLFRNQELPSELKVVGLSNEIIEGSDPVPFDVTVKIPGLDNKSPQKPRLVISYDGVSLTAGNSFLELDGSRYVIADSNKKEPEYLGEFRWKFSLMFDTKNISVQPQLAKDGSVMANADGSRVRLGFKVYNSLGLSTPDTLVQLKIRYNKGIASPRFDLSGLANKSLQVSRGENISLKFYVTSANSKAQLAVSLDQTSLPGQPTLACKAASAGSSKQNCLLTWKVPCDATPESLTGAIAMVAVDSTIADASSGTTQYSLPTELNPSEKKLCKTAGKN